MKDGLFTIGFVAFLAFRQFSNYWVSTSVNSVEELEPDMPLLELKRRRFDEQALARLWEGLEKLCAAAPVPVELACAPLERMRAKCGREHEKQGEESAKPEQLGGVFEKTPGWALKFNREGRSRLAGDDGWGFLQEYVDAVADSATNAFVLNCVIIPPQGVVAVPSSEDFEPAVGMHLDDTVGIDSARHYLAHSVSVLYLNVPLGMKGGELLLLRHADAKSSVSAGSKELEKRAHAKVSPEEGLLATFRGDAYRGVTALAAEAATDDDDELVERKSDSALGTARVSLVLEQYRIPSHLYKATTTF